MTNLEQVLKERENTHGRFSDHAFISQTLKDVMRSFTKDEQYSYLDLSPSQKESLDMIMHKVARILAGNPNEIDHWLDISGYSSLIVNELEHLSSLENTN